MKKLLFFLSLCFCITTNAQIADIVTEFQPVFNHGAKSCKSGKYKGQVVKGKNNGIGIIKLKNNGVYFGDVSDGVPDGFGVMLMSDGFKELPEAYVYSGRFKNGTMDGRARVYDENGTQIYEGRFSAGKPLDTFREMNERLFLAFEADDDSKVIGEISTLSYLNEGAVAIINKDGSVYVSNFTNGNPEDIGIYIDDNGEWNTFTTENGSITPISSSEAYKVIDAERKRVVLASLKELLPSLGQQLVTLGNELGKLSADIQKIGKSPTSNIESVDGIDAAAGSGSVDVDSNADQASLQQEYDYWGQRAWDFYHSASKVDIENAYKINKSKKAGDKKTTDTSLVRRANNDYSQHKRQFNSYKKTMMKFWDAAQGKGISLRMHKAHTLEYPDKPAQ